MRPSAFPFAPTRLLTVALAAMLWSGAAPAGAQQAITTGDLTNIHPREIGPAVTGGRIHDVEAVPSDPSILYVAAASGGVWRSMNRGHTWTPLTDDLPVSTFGDIALAPSNPSVVYAGTGEQNNRQSTSWGNGVYRSDDGGDTWRHLGLVETRHIGKVEVHPRNPDVVYVAALGNLWAPSETRGVFRSTDGGESWEKVLYVDEFTGAVDLVMDPQNPDVLYAATYQRLRRAWGFNGGGPGSGIYKTTDGGDSWTELTNGIPAGDKGRIGLAIAASNPRILNALIETADAETTGTYRTEDGGASWERVNPLDIRPMYYSEIFIDPTNPDRVFTMATSSHRSDDGGRTFTEIAVRPTYDVGVHADQHALWIDPSDSEHIYMGGDAGLHESYDAGETFRKINNFPISQFYAIGVDMRTPYRVYGGLQDNHSFAAPNETRRWVGIVNDDWQQVGFGDGMYWQPNPFDTTQAYGTSNGGTIFRLDTRTGDMLDIEPAEPEGEDYRWDWTTPIAASKHDPNTVYAAANRLFISRDRGSSWTRTRDLSKQINRDTLRLMGVPGADMTISPNDGTSSFGEATTLSESPVDPMVLWVGMDDGNLQVSRDGGATWTEVSGNVPGLPAGTYVSRIAASTTGAGAAYATFDAHRDGDFAPYVYRTTDYGRSWTPLHAGLPTGSVNVIVEHPDNADVLFLGTEHAAFASTDRGGSWAKIPNLPTTAYDDLVVHPRETDLVLGTHGRGIWILDDTRVLSEWNGSTAGMPVRVFPAGPATMFVYWKDTSYRADAEYAGENPPDGALITYRIDRSAGDYARMVVRNSRGDVVREMRVPGQAGVHRVNWDLRWGMPGETDTWERFQDPLLARPVDGKGPWVSPGQYAVTVESGNASATTSLLVQPDPMADLTALDYRVRENFMVEVLELMSAARDGMSGASGDRRDELQGAMRTLGRLVSNMNGSGIRGGTLHPPTDTQREIVAQARSVITGQE